MNEDKTLGIYIHIPFCASKCGYCDFYSCAGAEKLMGKYQEALLTHVRESLPQIQQYYIDSVYFGGGTPSVIDPKYLYGAMKQIKKCFRLAPRPEITIELNPGTVSESKIALYKRAGINRFSVGLQTAIDEQLLEVGRIHNVRDYLYCASLLKGENFSADIMLGLKGQTKEDVRKTVEVAAASGAKPPGPPSVPT